MYGNKVFQPEAVPGQNLVVLMLASVPVSVFSWISRDVSHI